jgi:hypothetical protein
MVMEVLKQVMKAAQETFDAQKKKKIKGIIQKCLIKLYFCNCLNSFHRNQFEPTSPHIPEDGDSMFL